MDYTVLGIIQARKLEWVAFPFSGDQTQVPLIIGGFFTSWATGKPKNTGVGSLSLLQRAFLTQQSNQGLLVEDVLYLPVHTLGFPVAQLVNNPPEMKETGFKPWFGKIPWRKDWLPTPVFLLGESYG